MFDKFDYFNRGYIFGVKTDKYNPYINYTWSMLPNGQVKNNGKSGTNLQLYSGNPLDFQGSQSISTKTITKKEKGALFVKIGAVPNSASVLISSGSNNRTYLGVQPNGTYGIGLGSNSYVSTNTSTTVYPQQNDSVCLVWENNTWKLYVNGSLVDNGIYSGTTISTSLLEIGGLGGSYLTDTQLDYSVYYDDVPTLTQIQQSYTNPNQFYDDMVNDDNTLFATDFRGTAGYIADDKNKVVGSAIIQDSGSKTSTHTDTRIGQVSAGLLVEAGKKYHISYKFDYVSTIGNFRAYIPPTCRTSGSSKFFSGLQNSNGVVDYLIEIPSDYVPNNESSSFYFWLEVDGTPTTTNFSDISVKEISAVYPITNYSETMRTNFQQETTGLQDLTRSFDSLGFYTGVTDYLNCNGVGYGDTGWVVPTSGDFTIEYITKIDSTKLGTYKLNGNNDFKIGLETNNKFASIYKGSYIYTGLIPTDGYHIATFVYDFNADNKCHTYVDGVFLYSYALPIDRATTLSVLLGMSSTSGQYKLSDEIRLFKVHNKVLTQQEITSNYNDYVAKGLLQ